MGRPRTLGWEPTSAFDTLWHFAAERQRIFFRRVAKEPWPWTTDPILSRFRFTNAYRASDRTSQFLIREVIYRSPALSEEVIFRILLFKLFNKIETWQLLETQLGELTYKRFRKNSYLRILNRAIERGAVYSPAYIMAPPSGEYVGMRKHEAHLNLLERMMRERLPRRIEAAASLAECFQVLTSYPMFGDFLAFQLAIDINYSEVTSFSEMDFVMPGPGARSGLTKCFPSASRRDHAALIEQVAESQESEFKKRGINFPSLWGRQLQLVDVQNLFCELDMYTRASAPSIAGLGSRTRIKRTFSGARGLPECWFPPKWQLNDSIAPSSSSTLNLAASLT
jgi:hypothetical protein